jgi:hypothetical protein
LILGAILASILLGVFTWLFLGTPLQMLYGIDFSDTVGDMSRTAIAGAILIGFSYIFNRFLGAHGEGKTLRNCAYVMGAVNVISVLWSVGRNLGNDIGWRCLFRLFDFLLLEI